MNRRSFIAGLAALPIIGRVVPKSDKAVLTLGTPLPPSLKPLDVTPLVLLEKGLITVNEYRAAIGLGPLDG